MRLNQIGSWMLCTVGMFGFTDMTLRLFDSPYTSWPAEMTLGVLVVSAIVSWRVHVGIARDDERRSRPWGMR